LEQFSDLGSGFNRHERSGNSWCGRFMGGEQSGFINEIGFDTYQKIMNEAIEELKRNEFKDLYPTENNLETKEYVKTCKSKLILNCCSLMNTSITLAND
jgi:transcription-repair coupling factor (superfamily II helicase)